MVMLTFANKGNNFIISSSITFVRTLWKDYARRNDITLKNNDITLHQGCINTIKSHKSLIFFRNRETKVRLSLVAFGLIYLHQMYYFYRYFAYKINF